jgi:protein tyrosine/serine phosphatase
MSSPDLIQRIVALPGIANFRDYGGYALSGGGRLATGRLFRSAQHLDATPEALSAVARIGFASVIDLRGGQERLLAPCPRPEGFAARVWAVEEETGGLLAPHLRAAEAAGQGISARTLMRDGYATMPFRWRMKGVLANYFHALAETDGPSLVHCAAGKDRTGLACALLHMAMGVHRDDVIADYLLTNEGADVEARVAKGAEDVRKTFGKELDDAEVRLIMLCEAEYIEAALDAIEARHGDVHAYLRDHLGIDRAVVDAVAARVTA